MPKDNKEILINSNPFEKRIAILVQSRLEEFFVERAKDRGLTGNVYKGRVVRVLPGMQSAFVEVGLARTAFLHVSDIQEKFGDLAEEMARDQSRPGSHDGRIQDKLKEGQEIMVQVAKEPIGTKGARVTGYVSLPGRYLVFMPGYDKVAISRRISSERERRRLRGIVSTLKTTSSYDGYGFIIRTVTEGVSKAEIKADMDYLVKLWESIRSRGEGAKTPALVYEELDLTLRTIRDLLTSDISRLVVDSPEEYERVQKFIKEFMPSLDARVDLYEGPDDILDAFGVDIELSDALDKKVWLKSGGHLVIDQMEALTAIDVNTGKYVGKKNSDDTILKTNLEAADAVVAQLKLRNIGGIIVIDFIDMSRAPHRDKLYNAFRDALKHDKARTNILKISELGIIEMTRKRVRESINQSLCESCPYCDGNGLVKSRDTVIMEIYRELARELPKRRRKVTLYVSGAVAERLQLERVIIDDLQKRFRKKIVIKPMERFHQERYEIL